MARRAWRTRSSRDGRCTARRCRTGAPAACTCSRRLGSPSSTRPSRPAPGSTRSPTASQPPPPPAAGSPQMLPQNQPPTPKRSPRHDCAMHSRLRCNSRSRPQSSWPLPRLRLRLPRVLREPRPQDPRTPRLCLQPPPLLRWHRPLLRHYQQNLQYNAE